MESSVVKILPLGNKIRRKVKEHGDVWRLVQENETQYLLETVRPVHCGRYSYGIWVDKKDCIILTEPLEIVKA